VKGSNMVLGPGRSMHCLPVCWRRKPGGGYTQRTGNPRRGYERESAVRPSDIRLEFAFLAFSTTNTHPRVSRPARTFLVYSSPGLNSATHASAIPFLIRDVFDEAIPFVLL